MTCDHCKQRVTAALAKVPGVMDVNVNLATGIATIDSDIPLEMSSLINAVEDAGFTA